ncbi:hypothetical protein [Microbacterium enclense]|uniref:hypothetical protein n=1 Tax=Microbacterium enclense TaxID=993073 RepID=UPI003F7CE823
MQGVGFVVGIVLVRALTKEDFALYSICVSVTAAGIALSEGGVSGVLMAEGPRFHRVRRRFATILHGAVRFRRVIALFMIVPSSVILLVMLSRNGADPLLTAVSTVIVVLTMWFSLERGLLQIPLRLDGRYIRIQRSSLLSAALRLVLIGVLAVLGLIGVWEALAVICLSTVFEIALLRRSLGSLPRIRPPQRTQAVVRGRLNLALRRTLPATITGVLQGQAFLLTLSFLSSPAIIAEVSALGRFSVIYVVFSAFFLDVVSGRFARERPNRAVLRKWLTVALASYAAIVVVTVLIMAWASEPVLLLLGEDYSDLRAELVVVSTGSGLIALGNAWRNLNFARNWVSGSWIFIPTTLIWLLIGIFAIDLADVFAASCWMAGQSAAALIAQAFCSFIGIRSTRSSEGGTQ